jgi:putative phosphoribosyl transferase
VTIPVGAAMLEGELILPEGATGIVLFAHGSGSSRHSPRNRRVAGYLREASIGTLLFDLLTSKEEGIDLVTGHLRFDIGLLGERLVGATAWLGNQPGLQPLCIGYFGASTGGGAALVAAAELGDRVSAVVSRGGRPDLAGAALPNVMAATLLLVGEYDEPVIAMNQAAYEQLRCIKALGIVPGATHLFEEPGALEEVARLATEWFQRHLRFPSDADCASGGAR